MKAVAAWIVLCLVWSSTWMVIKVGLIDLPPLFFAGSRFVIACIALVTIARFQHIPVPDKKDWALIAWTGVLTFSVNYGCLFWGERHIASGLAAILQATIPAFGMVFAHCYLPNEPITLRKALGIMVGLLGVGVIFSNKVHSTDPLALRGGVAVVFGAFSVSHANVLLKARGSHVPPVTLAAGQMFCGCVPLLAASATFEGHWLSIHWRAQAVFALLYLALVGSALTFCLLYWLLQHTDATKVMLISLITPVAAVAIGILYLGESLSWRSMLGAGCVLAGIGMLTNPFRHWKTSTPLAGSR